LVWFDSYWRGSACVANRLSLVFHMVDRVLVFLSESGVAFDERYLHPGLYASDQRGWGGTAAEFIANASARVWTGVSVALLPQLGGGP
jgi:hypothetical protein